MYIPSTDFQLFSLPQFGGLFSDSLGLQNSFQASDPQNYVNYALNSFAQILKPQTPTQIPSQPNYGAGIEVGNIGDLFNLPPLISPQFPSFQGKAPQPYYDPPTITVPLPANKNLPPVFDPNRTPEEIARDPYGVTIINQIPVLNDPQTRSRIPIWSKDYPMVSDGSGSGDKRVIGDDPTKSGDKAQSVSDFFKTLPAGSGIFLIAIAIIILILLFARGR